MLNFLNITVLWLCKEVSSFLKKYTKVKEHEVYNLVSNSSENNVNVCLYMYGGSKGGGEGNVVHFQKLLSEGSSCL